MRNKWIYRAPAIGWGFVVLYLCLAPVSTLAPAWEMPIHISDKAVHFIMYFAWVFLFYFASSRAYRLQLSRGKIITWWIIASVLGVIIELLQGWMGLGRSADAADALANTAGALAGLGVSRLAHNRLEQFLGFVRKR